MYCKTSSYIARPRQSLYCVVYISTPRRKLFLEDGQKQKYCYNGRVNVSAVSSTSTDWRERTPDGHMQPVDVAELSVDGWQLNEDAIVTQSQRLVPSLLANTVEQCRPGIGASSCRVCT